VTYLSDDSPWVFLVLTCVLGGGAAFLAGRGLARGWKPFWRVFSTVMDKKVKGFELHPSQYIFAHSYAVATA